MSNLSINIVSLDVPYPPDYGGVIDIFFKIKTLYHLGIKVHLHCFEYVRPQREEIRNYCETVHYYERKTGIRSNLSLIPYIIYSRRGQKLLSNLQSNNYPILFEGLHSVYFILAGKLQGRQMLLRSHNIEHDYYRHLASRETNFVKKIYFQKEAFLLERVLEKLPISLPIAAISSADTDYLKKRFPRTFWLPPFHSNDKVKSLSGSGGYALYHGNLSVSENFEVAEVLMSQFANKDIKLVLAGKEPPERLLQLGELSDNITIIANPDKRKMTTLIQEAHAILLPTYQSTGIKLKLIESLYRGRHCIANQPMVENTRVEELVITEEKNFYKKTKAIIEVPFTQSNQEDRRTVLESHYDNLDNGRRLIDVLMGLR